jgi:acyl-CoA synthetase (AMP-forming)/AMP-acid ligase II
MVGEAHVGARLHALASAVPDRIAVVDETGAWSFAQLDARVVRFGNALRGLGLQPGDRVALLMPDIREYLEADYGTMAGGFVRAPLDPRLARRELIAQLRYAQARALVTHASFAASSI